MLFEGVGVALVTLFQGDGSLDVAATTELASNLVELGVRAVVVAGSTGEAAALEAEERSQLLRAVRGSVPSSVPVIAGTGAPSRVQAAELTRRALRDGADGVLVLSPPGSRDLAAYYGAVREAAGDGPVLGYHFPSTSAPGIPLDVLAKLPLDGCKDSSGDAARLLFTLEVFDHPLYVGSASLLALAGPLGVSGAILALANSHPELCAAAFTGDAAAERALTVPLRRAAERFPGGIKQLVAERFGTSTASRL